MRKILQKIPLSFRILFLFMGITWMNLIVTKCVFYLVNRHSFTHLKFSDLLVATWFDWVTCGWVFLPFALLWLLPLKKRSHPTFFIAFRILFFTLNGLVIALNLLDVVYFEFTAKRSTLDLFSMVGYGQDVQQLWGSFLRDFWYLVLILLVLLYVSDKLFCKVYSIVREGKVVYGTLSQLVGFLTGIATLVLLARGGFALKPIDTIDAAQYTQPENAAFVLNTTFTMLKSFDHSALQEKKYFSESQLSTLFSPIRTIEPDSSQTLPPQTNIVVIILESFGNEWVGKDANENSFTPFLDSLMEQGYAFSNAFSNGKKSIEGIPAVIAGIPALMDNPYISSNYAGNKIVGIGNVMKKHGYSTSFYHGATNGSMNFDGFSALVGFDRYVGRKEYNNDADNDGTWGIYDHCFLPWAAEQFGKGKTPFCNVIFTLSSHHPYKIPEKYQGKLKKGPSPLCQSINYTDESLRLFFEAAKKQPWYENTLFVFTADHTSSSQNDFYSNRIGMYGIPIFFFSPSQILGAKKDERIFQQIDIFPTLLDLLGWDEKIYAIGSSTFDKAQDRFAVSYLEGTYQLFQDDYVLTFAGDKQLHLYNFKCDSLMQKDSVMYLRQRAKQMKSKLKAIIQTYNNNLIYNRTLAQ